MDPTPDTPPQEPTLADTGRRRWPGISPFRVEEHDRFYGRDRDIAELARLFERPKSGQNAMVWLHGAPGVGKTSLVMAGLIPRLRQSWGHDIGTLLLSPEGEESGDGLIEEIAESILSIAPTDGDTSRSARLRQFELLLEEDRAEAAEFLAACFRRNGEKDGPARGDSICLLVLDDVEKMASATNRYRLPQDDTDWVNGELGVMLSFLHLLTMTGAFPVLVTMGTQSVPVIKDALIAVEKPNLGSWNSLSPLEAKELRPFFAKSSTASEKDLSVVSVSNELFDVIMLDAADRPAALPFISEALRERARDEPGAIQLEIGDHDAGSGMIRKYAEVAQRAFEKLPDDIQHELPRLMTSMRPASGKNQFVSCAYEELTKAGDHTILLVNHLIDHRILELTGDSPENLRVSFTIPAAVPEWAAARDWLDRDAAFAEQVSVYREKLAHWDSHDQTSVFLIHAPKALARAREILDYHRDRPFLDTRIVNYFEQSIEMSSELDVLQGEIRTRKALLYGGISLLILLVIAVICYLILK